MRAIAKGNEPACLTEHRASAHCDYANYQGKPALRAALIAEQRGLCCYCMSRISADSQKMKIEHWQCQASFPDQQLVYGNLLGACKGGEGGGSGQQHCDTLKGKQPLRWNPANPAHSIESRVAYRNNGEIRSNDDEFDGELETVLNLNISLLRNSRKSVLDVVLQWWQKTSPSPAKVQARIAKYDNGNDELVPFSSVAVWFLKRKLAA